LQGGDMMKIVVLEHEECYDGSQLSPLWALSKRVKGDSIVAFKGPMNVVDIKDAEDTDIRGDELIHFIMERFSNPPTMMEAYLIQRLFLCCLCDVLREEGFDVVRKGGDLYMGEGKLTVSIASISPSSEKFHCGVNLTTSGTPEDVEVSAIHVKDWKAFAENVAMRFVSELDDIERDISKSRTL